MSGGAIATQERRVPARALAFSLLTLLVPLAATWWAPEWTEGDGALLIWLPALLPPFLLAYYRGWRGASLAMAGGMATLALTQVEILLLDLPAPAPAYILGIVVLLLAVALGAGWIADLLLAERAAAEQTALTDALTGLPNRRHASVFLEAAWGSALRGRNVAVVLFDLDAFKHVNDTYGHAEGDEVLRAVGDVLSRRTRRSDLSARFGGEEFISILTDCTLEQAATFAESVRLAVGSLAFAWGRITLSAGVSGAREGMGSPDVLLATADRALYEAKERGRDRVVSLATAVASARPPAPTLRTRTSLVGCRVLLVDDDELTLRATTAMLRHLGCVVHATESSRTALSELSTGEAVDILVTDIIMPDMSGFTLADLASKARPGLPVLYISGYPRAEVYWGGTPGTRSAFLGKPLETDDVRRILLDLLGADDPGASTAPGKTEVPSPTTAPAPGSRFPDGDGRESRPPAEVPSGDTGGAATSGRILVVDDDAAVVKSLQRFFTRKGYPAPIGLTDPRKVVDTLRREDVDLVILDLAMGEMDGFDVLEAISGHLDGEEFLPVIMLTGSDHPGTRRKALAAGAMDFLSKPFDPVEAEARVRNLLTTRFLTQRVARQRDSLEEEVGARTSELADTRSEILFRLARAAEYRDDVTGRHAERVGLLASSLGSALGLPPREVDLLRRTGPLHDIGKIGVPDAILLKPGSLTPAEFEIIKSHTTIGAQILGGSHHRILEVARNIALSHHERWDGRGYPQGLEGTRIPLEARIVAVADAFDTITHARPYKPALTPREGLAEILRCGGTHYDPDVVEAMDAVRERVGLDHLHELSAPLNPLRDTGPGTA